MKTTIVILIAASVISFFLGTLAYVRDTIRGRSKPNRMTFLIWALGPFIAVAAGSAAGGGWVLLITFVSGFGPLCILLASYLNKEAYWKLGVLDYACGVLALLALLLWSITNDPIIAIILAIVADALALYPTLLKAWSYPETETGVAYIAALFSASVGLALASNGVSETAFLIYLVLLNAVVTFAIYRRRLLVFLRGA